MLTRLKVSGFKNLVEVDVRFGPFTCVAGPNGVGKSNLFDAIRFLSALADRTLMDAALSVREGRTADVRSLFHRVGDEYDRQMDFAAEMIIPREGTDELGQHAEATTTFLRYSISLGYRGDTDSPMGPLEILTEKLSHITLGRAHEHLLFPHKVARWRRSAVVGRRSAEFISTEQQAENRVIKLHQDGSGGKPAVRMASSLPRTVLSATLAAESPTATLARKEMQSWTILQLEPSALRSPDAFVDPQRLGRDGSHLAATLYRLARSQNGGSKRVYARVANRLATLIDDVRDVWIDRDERREQLSLYASGKDKTPHAARALSDGTLRFLALAVLAEDPEAQGVLCLEEPENGIHPERIPAMIELLRDIATDPDVPIGDENPLRQVIINTHSPAFVLQVPDDSLLVAHFKEMVRPNKRFLGVGFSPLPDSWRAKDRSTETCSKGELLAYLNPIRTESSYLAAGGESKSRVRRVLDRIESQLDFDNELNRTMTAGNE